jgi:hypothetical protein
LSPYSRVSSLTDRRGQRLSVAPTREQLLVSLDEKPVAVESVARVTTPASILLLVDLTWTVTRGHHPGQDAATTQLRANLPRIASPGRLLLFPGLVRGLEKSFLPLLGPDDGLMVGSFAGQRSTFRRVVTPNRANQRAALDEVVSPGVVPLDDWYGPARIWDAVAAASGRG